MTANKDSVTVAGMQGPMAEGYKRAEQQGGGIKPEAHPDPMKESRDEMLRNMRNFGSSILGAITGKPRNVTGNNMSPTTTKDK